MFVVGGRRFVCNWVLFAAFAVGCSDAVPDVSGVVRNGDEQPRLLAPLSGSVSGSRQPVLTFTGAREARVEICHDRACASPLWSLDGTGGQAQPEAPLPAGTVFWRAVARGRISATWQLVIPARESGATPSVTVPDYNGDGLADVAVGQPGPASGVVAVFYGTAAGVSASPDVLMTGGDQFGRAVATVGDVNGDGYVDLAVASGGDPGTVNVYDGGAAGPTLGNALLPGPVTSGFGATMAAAGDVNGDGYGDLVVGGREAAQVFLGSARGMAVTAAFTLTGN